MAAVGGTCSSLQTNPDIGGIGVRHSFYIQSLCLLALLFLNSGRRVLSALQILLWTSFGLAVTAVVQAILGSLTFLEALQASNLIWLTNFSSFLILLFHFRKHRFLVSRYYAIQVSAIAHNLTSMVLTLAMWSNPVQFGSQRECVQDVQYAFFVVRVPAMGSVRIACLTVTSCLFLAYSVFAAYELQSLYKLYRREAAQAKLNNALPTLSPDALRHPKIDAFYSQGEKQRRCGKFDPFMGVIALSYATATGYFMGSTDHLVFHNPAVYSASQQWGFGQILAMIVVIPTVISVCIETVVALRRRARGQSQIQLSDLHWDRRAAGPV